jgi:cytochrome c peroxidase
VFEVMKKIVSLAVLIGFSCTIYFSCSNNQGEQPAPITGAATPYQFPDIAYFPKNLNIPEDNPMTEEGVLLGKYLFYDGRLSGNTEKDQLMSCATCHMQKYGFEIGIDHSVFTEGQTFGLSGKPTLHYPMPLVNLVYNHNGYLWNGFVNESNNTLGAAAYGVAAEEQFHFKNIESLVWMSITSPHEMNSTVDMAVKSIKDIPMYPPMFKKAFGTEEINYDRISKAIAQFVRSIISYRSKFHQWLRHETELTDSERRGHDLFFSEDADCFHCHGGSVLMTTNQYYNNAKDNFFNDKSDRYSITGDPMDIGAYRAPSLINVELRAPYMHDGRFKSLSEVIDFYSSGLVYSDFVNPLMKGVRDRGVQLTEDQKADLTAFLYSLTDHDLLSDPAYSCPPELVQWSGQHP